MIGGGELQAAEVGWDKEVQGGKLRGVAQAHLAMAELAVSMNMVTIRQMSGAI